MGVYLIDNHATSPIGCGFRPQIELETLKLLFAASRLSIQHLGVKGTGRHRVRIIYVGKAALLLLLASMLKIWLRP